ncbi:Frataxin-like domain-containing protein [Halenospora varia]|nr:Frataxin-like domain-containing protein [Halenospora varia]
MMTRAVITKLAGRVPCKIRPCTSFRGASAAQSSLLRQFVIPSATSSPRAASVHPRYFSNSRTTAKGLSPETENPHPKEPEPNSTLSASGPADITADEYHELSDQYMEALVDKLEQLQEEDEQVDCEYSAGVLTVAFPPNGTYVINKQPPNKQIWLSSPITGPKRYDFVMASEGQDAKEGTGSGEWIYLRDGTSLNDLLLKELGVDMSDPYAPAPHLGE